MFINNVHSAAVSLARWLTLLMFAQQQHFGLVAAQELPSDCASLPPCPAEQVCTLVPNTLGTGPQFFAECKPIVHKDCADQKCPAGESCVQMNPINPFAVCVPENENACTNFQCPAGESCYVLRSTLGTGPTYFTECHVPTKHDCDDLQCSAGEACVLKNFLCQTTAPCAPAAVCVPEKDNVCATHQCPAGQTCVTKDVCTIVTCPPVPECQPTIQ